MFKGVHQSLEAIESIVPIPGGAVSVVTCWSLGAFNGHLNPPSRDRMSLVLAPDGNRFVNVHDANITIVEEVQRFDPALQGSKS